MAKECRRLVAIGATDLIDPDEGAFVLEEMAKLPSVTKGGDVVAHTLGIVDDASIRLKLRSAIY